MVMLTDVQTFNGGERDGRSNGKLNGDATKEPKIECQKLTGVLDQYSYFHNTPCLGSEFRNVSLKEIMEAPNSDEILRDIGVLICQRGVCFFRGQTDMTPELQKEFVRRVGWLVGRSKDHDLHMHTMHKVKGDDPHMQKIDQEAIKAMFFKDQALVQSLTREWHTDNSFENCPPDFSCLRMTEVAPVGCDTLWASSYELYDRLSEGYQKFFESLTAIHDAPALREAAEKHKDEIYTGPRGAPENVGFEYNTPHPMVRTHPVTGWKTLFGTGFHCKRINNVTEEESQALFTKINDLIQKNHDLQVRFHWDGPGDLAIWDNRAAMHAATMDNHGYGRRTGYRCMGMAEKPFLDVASPSRREDLKARGNAYALTV